MTTIVKHKRSSTASSVPVVGDLDLGEIAVNDRDGKVFIKTDDGVGGESVVEVGSNPSTLTINSAVTFPTADGTNKQILVTDGSGTLTFETTPYATYTSVLATTATDQVIYTYLASQPGSRITLAATHATAGKHICDLLMTSDGTDLFFTQFGDVTTQSELFTLSSDVSVGSARLLITPVNTNTTVKLHVVEL